MKFICEFKLDAKCRGFLLDSDANQLFRFNELR